MLHNGLRYKIPTTSTQHHMLSDLGWRVGFKPTLLTLVERNRTALATPATLSLASVLE
jgi:hypothetical protein